MRDERHARSVWSFGDGFDTAHSELALRLPIQPVLKTEPLVRDRMSRSNRQVGKIQLSALSRSGKRRLRWVSGVKEANPSLSSRKVGSATAESG